mgnify:CR=1 FL=1
MEVVVVPDIISTLRPTAAIRITTIATTTALITQDTLLTDINMYSRRVTVWQLATIQFRQTILASRRM